MADETKAVPTVVAAPDINRSSANIALPTEVSGEIWAKTLDESAIMSLTRQIQVPGTGLTVQTITGEPAADWVDEGNAKPVSTHSFGKKGITPYKLAVIEPFSNEFRRDKEALYAECINRLPYAIAKKFDETVLGTAAPGSNFDVLGGCAKQPIKGKTYEAFLKADEAIATADGIMNGIALGAKGKSIVLVAEQDGDNVREDVATMLFERTGGTAERGATKDGAEGRSVLYPASTTVLSRGSYCPAGSDGVAFAAKMLAGCINAPVEAEGGFTLNDHVVFDIGSTVLDAAWAVLAAGNYVMQVTGRGVVRIVPKPDAPAAKVDAHGSSQAFPTAWTPRPCRTATRRCRERGRAWR